MKITRFVHSCLLVETPNRAGLFDPGQFSWESGLFNIEKLARLDDIIITHDHFDHFHLPFVKALVGKFPEVTITTNPTIAATLQKEGFKNVQTTNNGPVELFATNHESIAPLGPQPDHTGAHYLGQLTHPGDSHHFTQTKQILALPVTGPWGGMMRAAQLGLDLKPKYIIPIHDWHWNESARAGAYDRLQAFFAENNITFIKTTDGEPVEIDV